MLSSHRRAFARSQVQMDFKRAISSATRIGARAIVVPIDSGSRYQVGIDKAPFSASAVPDEVLYTAELPTDITISTTDTLIVDPRGFVINTLGSLTTVNYSILDHGSQFATVTVYAPGNIQIL